MSAETLDNRINGAIPEIEVPQQERKYALMYLAVVLDGLKRPLTRQDIHRLAAEIYSDSDLGEPRSLRETCEAAAILPKGKASADPFLNHVALNYSKTEMDKVKKYSTEPRKPTDIPRSSVDVRAGEGPARPILKDLYSLESLGLIVVVENGDSEVFVPLHAARSLARTKSLLYRHAKWEPNVLLVTDAYSWHPHLRKSSHPSAA